jgi:hypothetical protein
MPSKLATLRLLEILRQEVKSVPEPEVVIPAQAGI